MRGAIHSRAYIHSNKPRAKLAEKVMLECRNPKLKSEMSISQYNFNCVQLLKRDVISTLATRVQMLLEELLTSEEDNSRGKQQTGKHTRKTRLPLTIISFRHR